MGISERRDHRRLSVSIQAQLTQADTVLHGEFENVSAAGAFFRTVSRYASLPEGAAVQLVFQLPPPNPQDAPTEIAGTILRAERFFEGSHVIHSFAVRFDSLITLELP